MYYLRIVPVPANIVEVHGKVTRLIGYFSNCRQNINALFIRYSRPRADP